MSTKPSWIIQKSYAKGHGGGHKKPRKPAQLRGCNPAERQIVVLAMRNSGELAQVNATRDAANRERQQASRQTSYTYRW